MTFARIFYQADPINPKSRDGLTGYLFFQGMGITQRPIQLGFWNNPAKPLGCAVCLYWVAPKNQVWRGDVLFPCLSMETPH
jgi:hypothetical protein